jgi:hypothetical protein
MLVPSSHARRAWVRAFALIVALWILVGGALAVAIFAGDHWRGWAAFTAAVSVLLATVGLARPQVLVPVYRLWARTARAYARVARLVLFALCYAVITVVGTGGAALRLRRPAPGDSLWTARETQPRSTYRSPFEGTGPSWTGRPWRALAAWALRRPFVDDGEAHGARVNAWAVTLIPFIVLVSFFDTDENVPHPAGIYTLF